MKLPPTAPPAAGYRARSTLLGPELASFLHGNQSRDARHWKAIAAALPSSRASIAILELRCG